MSSLLPVQGRSINVQLDPLFLDTDSVFLLVLYAKKARSFPLLLLTLELEAIFLELEALQLRFPSCLYVLGYHIFFILVRIKNRGTLYITSLGVWSLMNVIALHILPHCSRPNLLTGSEQPLFQFSPLVPLVSALLLP